MSHPGTSCGVARTLQVLDGKWTTLIVRELLAAPLKAPVGESPGRSDCN
ncbi:hypothetical protein [Kribbella sp. NPDC006257]